MSGFGKKIVVTGMGTVNPIGKSIEEYWKNLINGESGIDRIRAFDPTGFPVQIAGEVKQDDLSTLIPSSLPACPTSPLPHRTVLLSLAASGQAILAAGLDPRNWNPQRVGVYLGVGIGTMDFPAHATAVRESFDNGDLLVPRFMKGIEKQGRPYLETELDTDPTLDAISMGWNIEGPQSISLTACAASAQAIGEACYWIGKGMVDIVLTGGSHSIVDPFGITGFGHLTALSTRNDDPKRACRPFDKDRDGFVLAEGAGTLILESEEYARARGAEILAEIAGYGLSTDAYRVTDPDPTAESPARAMSNALRMAGMSSDQVDVVNAHGTSTQANDRVETMAIKKVLGERAYRVPVHSIKSMTGHSIAAAGVLEAIAAIQTLSEGVVPPTLNYQTPDPDCDLDYVPNEAREIAAKMVLSNSFGFGGQNVSLAIKEYMPC
ncbi:MAG: beta-ketoacyl-[acyl-carrier-protein] synthase family protein [Candidatus Omnitrophica bacterium]|nr:beta-ketoacyl-[acyl-carrier-protein] synthase family protein [Candidatus Omnitrophota bacterium]